MKPLILLEDTLALMCEATGETDDTVHAEPGGPGDEVRHEGVGGAGQQARPHLQQPQPVVLSSVQLAGKSSINSAAHLQKSASNELLYSVDGNDKSLCSSEEPGLPPERVRAAGGDDGGVVELGEQLRLQAGQQHVELACRALEEDPAARRNRDKWKDRKDRGGITLT